MSMQGIKSVKEVIALSAIAAICIILISCGSAKTSGEKIDDGTSPAAQVDPADQSSTEKQVDRDGDVNKDKKNGGDFDVSGPLFVWVEWDGDGDGEEEQLSFRYKDGGDEFVSFILVTLEEGDYPSSMIDRAGKIVRIYSREDDDGPYLLVEYSYENVVDAETDASCEVRLKDGEVEVKEI